MFGAEHFRTLEDTWLLALVLVRQRKLDEALAIHTALLPVARRVLGPADRVTVDLVHPRFLDPDWH